MLQSNESVIQDLKYDSRFHTSGLVIDEIESLAMIYKSILYRSASYVETTNAPNTNKTTDPGSGEIDRSAFLLFYDIPGLAGEQVFNFFKGLTELKGADSHHNIPTISFNEFLQGHLEFCKGDFEHQAKILFRMFDVNGDNLISIEDFMSVISSTNNACAILRNWYQIKVESDDPNKVITYNSRNASPILRKKYYESLSKSKTTVSSDFNTTPEIISSKSNKLDDNLIEGHHTAGDDLDEDEMYQVNITTIDNTLPAETEYNLFEHNSVDRTKKNNNIKELGTVMDFDQSISKSYSKVESMVRDIYNQFGSIAENQLSFSEFKAWLEGSG